MSNNLIEKYSVRVPRYTSYPSIPLWNDTSFHLEDWQSEIRKIFHEGNSLLSLYLHLPFCEKPCTYCGCNKRITVNHSVEEPYINALLDTCLMLSGIFRWVSLVISRISQIYLPFGMRCANILSKSVYV